MMHSKARLKATKRSRCESPVSGQSWLFVGWDRSKRTATSRTRRCEHFRRCIKYPLRSSAARRAPVGVQISTKHHDWNFSPYHCCRLHNGHPLEKLNAKSANAAKQSELAFEFEM
ncbi:hypothetical protein EVAR_9615_1 [Eumeta japonica]|uniref:Uncharacterized protein n=1 Tax=Eumeta variegata TaxID=151549 RepID=A0A4C1TM88_EUMVA|nr:hypothetical protein EVAR_9615_1 [Eumeta japonica]